MKAHGLTMAKTAIIVAAVFFVLAFTPLKLVPMLFSLSLESGPTGIFLLLCFIGAPLGFYLFTLLFSSANRRVHDIFQLTGFWIGSYGGSTLGVKAAGVL